MSIQCLPLMVCMRKANWQSSGGGGGCEAHMWFDVAPPSFHPDALNHIIFPIPFLFIADAHKAISLPWVAASFFISLQLPVVRHFQDVNTLTSNMLQRRSLATRWVPHPNHNKKKKKTLKALMKLFEKELAFLESRFVFPTPSPNGKLNVIIHVYFAAMVGAGWPPKIVCSKFKGFCATNTTDTGSPSAASRQQFLPLFSWLNARIFGVSPL